MRRLLLTVAAVALLLVLLPALIVNLIAAGAEPVESPDPARPIHLPDGSTRPLAELIDRWTAEQGEPAAVTRDGAAPQDTPEPTRDARDRDTPPDAEQIARAIEQVNRERATPPDGSDPWALAEWHRSEGDLDDAKALYLALPVGHPKWARAQRRLGWDCFAKDDDAARGVPFVHASLAADPSDGNAWQDTLRVYASTLGLPTH